jgi:hypothetical protein
MATSPRQQFGAVIAVNLSLPAFAAEEPHTTDIGTIDKESGAKVFPSKPPYSHYARCNFPARPFFCDTHTQSHGRGNYLTTGRGRNYTSNKQNRPRHQALKGSNHGTKHRIA